MAMMVSILGAYPELNNNTVLRERTNTGWIGDMSGREWLVRCSRVLLFKVMSLRVIGGEKWLPLACVGVRLRRVDPLILTTILLLGCLFLPSEHASAMATVTLAVARLAALSAFNPTF